MYIISLRSTVYLQDPVGSAAIEHCEKPMEGRPLLSREYSSDIYVSREDRHIPVVLRHALAGVQSAQTRPRPCRPAPPACPLEAAPAPARRLVVMGDEQLRWHCLAGAQARLGAAPPTNGSPEAPRRLWPRRALVCYFSCVVQPDPWWRRARGRWCRCKARPS